LPSYAGPSTTPLPGDFYAEFGFVVSITHLALQKWQNAAALRRG
jgi:hypothetical protein